MKVLQLIPQFKVGGTEKGTIELAAYLVRQNHRTVVISGGGDMVRELTAIGARHYQLPVHRKNPLIWGRMIFAVARIIRGEKIEIVHARSRVPALIGYFACRLTGAEFVTTCHGYYRKHLLSRVMGWGKRVIVASNCVGRHMIEDFGVPRERIRLIPRGVDLKEFAFSKTPPAGGERKTFRVGMIGRMSPIKGHRYFLQAAARLVRIFPRTRIIIVGDTLSAENEALAADRSWTGYLRRLVKIVLPPAKYHYKLEIEQLARDLGISSLVEFRGIQRDVPAVLRELDLLVLATTTEEAFGRVIIEAQAAGVPVVATRVGGVVDIVEDGKTGLLVPPEDSRALAEAMVTICRDPELAYQLSLAARKKVEKEFARERMVSETFKVYRELEGRKNILVVKLSALGDVMLAIPSLRALRQKFPGAKISLVTEKKSLEVIQRCPYVDEVITFGGRDGRRSFARIWRAGRRLRRGGFDLVIDLQNNRASHLLAYLSGARERCGYHNGKWSFFLNRRVRDDKAALSPARHQLRVLRLAGVESIEEKLELWPIDRDEEAVDALLTENWVAPGQKLVGINLGGSVRHPAKRWPLAYCARLVDELAKKHRVRAVVTGGPGDGEAAEEFSRLTGAHPVIAVGRTTIHQLFVLIKRCRVFVTGDSLALHVAAAAGVPVIALFGPTNPARHLSPAGGVIVVRHDLKCSPCYRSWCEHQRCLREIKAEEVLAKVEDFIADHAS